MDPNETLRRWRDARKRKDELDADDALSDLREWIFRGGFVPSGMTRAEKAALSKGMRARRIPINSQGYDSRGRYYGVGMPVYEISHPSGFVEYVRARTASEAKRAYKVNPVKANPIRHFPRTAKGRPKVKRRFELTLYGEGAKGEIVLATRRASVPRDEATAMARGFVGSKWKGRVIHRVVLDGPK